jgi:hypothetical protein
MAPTLGPIGVVGPPAAHIGKVSRPTRWHAIADGFRAPYRRFGTGPLLSTIDEHVITIGRARARHLMQPPRLTGRRLVAQTGSESMTSGREANVPQGAGVGENPYGDRPQTASRVYARCDKIFEKCGLGGEPWAQAPFGHAPLRRIFFQNSYQQTHHRNGRAGRSAEGSVPTPLPSRPFPMACNGFRGSHKQCLCARLSAGLATDRGQPMQGWSRGRNFGKPRS